MENPSVQRRAFPIAAREISEALVGQSLVGIHAVTGELVELVAARLGTPAFAIGSEVFVTEAGLSSQAVLVHEAVHTAQQRASSPGARWSKAPPTPSTKRIASCAASASSTPSARASRGVARAPSMAVRAALGRSPKISTQAASLSAYEPTLHDQAAEILHEGKQLAEALAQLLESGADAATLQDLAGALDDDRAERIRKVALYELGRRP